MAAGDTISGQLRVMRQLANGELQIVLGAMSHLDYDWKATPANAMQVNVPRQRAPVGAVIVYTKDDGIFKAGEKIVVQHLSASLAEAADVDGDDEWFIGVLEEDLNRGGINPKTLTLQDQEIAVDPTTSITVWTNVFEYTVPDRTDISLFGRIMMAVTETA